MFYKLTLDGLITKLHQGKWLEYLAIYFYHRHRICCIRPSVAHICPLTTSFSELCLPPLNLLNRTLFLKYDVKLRRLGVLCFKSLTVTIIKMLAVFNNLKGGGPCCPLRDISCIRNYSPTHSKDSFIASHIFSNLRSIHLKIV